MRVPRSRQGVLADFFPQTAIFSPPRSGPGPILPFPTRGRTGVALALRLEWRRSFLPSWDGGKWIFSGALRQISADFPPSRWTKKEWIGARGPCNPRTAVPPAPRAQGRLGRWLSTAASPSVALQASILVLNRLYMAVHVIGVRRAFALLCRELAEVIHHEEGVFANYTFESWRDRCSLCASCKRPHEDWIRAVNFQIQVPARHSPLDLRPPPQTEPAPESSQRTGPGRPCVPVLRPALPHPSAEPRPRGPAEPRGNDHLGKHRLCLSGM